MKPGSKVFYYYITNTKTMIGRIWHGWTSFENADAYERLLKEEIIPEIADKKMTGYKEIQVFRRPLKDEVEFITVMWFKSLNEVKQFVGEDYEQAHVPAKAQKLLSRYDKRSQHYEIRDQREY